jgi:N-methylhydantoinase A
LPRKSCSARIGVDVGGTFTDIVLALPDGQIHVNKTTTTPLDPGEGVATGVAAVLAEAGLDPSEVAEVVHGTTVASNAILQKIGARTGLLTTRGFRDVLEVGRIRTPGMFQLGWRKPEPLVPRRWRLEATERIAADASVVTPLDETTVREAAATFLAEQVVAVAVCFINSYANDSHERRAVAILRECAPSLLVTASCEVLPEIKEYERTSTAVVNAYLLPTMRGYLSKLAERLRDIGVTAPVQVMASNGGMIGIAAARDRPVFAVGSGPAGGVIGAARLGLTSGAKDLIVFDMGGTTAKAAIVQGGEPQVITEYEFRDGISAPSRFVKGARQSTLPKSVQAAAPLRVSTSVGSSWLGRKAREVIPVQRATGVVRSSQRSRMRTWFSVFSIRIRLPVARSRSTLRFRREW